MKVTITAIKNLPAPGNQRRTFWDETIPGFGITQFVNGSVSYVAKFRIGSGRSAKQVMRTIGTFEQMTPEKARTNFKTMSAQARLGVDAKEKEVAERKSKVTLAELCDEYLEGHAKHKKRERSAYEDSRKIRYRIKPYFKSKKAAETTRADIDKFHKGMAWPARIEWSGLNVSA